MDFNALDVLLGGILLVSVVGAARKGITKELIGIASLVAGVIVAMWGHGLLAQSLRPWIQNPQVASMVAFGLIFVGCLVAGGLLARALEGVWKFTGLRWLDMLLGGVFGLFRWLLIAAVLLVALLAFRPFDSVARLVTGSALAQPVLDVARTVAALAPRALRLAFKDGVDMIDDDREAAEDEADGDGSQDGRTRRKPLEDGALAARSASPDPCALPALRPGPRWCA